MTDLDSRVSSLERGHERHTVILETLTRDFNQLRTGMATRELVDTSVSALAAQVASTEQALSLAIENQGKNVDLKLKHIKEQVEPIRKGIWGLIWVVLVAIVGAVMTMVLNGPPPLP